MSRVTWHRASAPLAVLALLAACGPDAEFPLAPAARKPAPTPPPNPEIAYSDGGLVVMNADGSNLALLVSGNWVGNPTWAPAAPGATRFRIAYSNIDLGEVDLVDLTTSGGAVRAGTPRRLAAGGEPAWSPQGDEIAYTASLPDGRIGVFTMDTLGGNQAVIPQTVLPGGVMRPTWRADGLALAFWQDRDPNGPDPTNKQIRIITRATRQDPWSEPRTVYRDPDPSAGNALDWARTKDVLAFTAGYSGAPLLLLTLGQGLVPTATKADTVGHGARPSWSPDDRYLVYYGNGLTRFELETRTATQLARRTGCCRPSWRR
jgi:Tol biopolymer transport system component